MRHMATKRVILLHANQRKLLLLFSGRTESVCKFSRSSKKVFVRVVFACFDESCGAPSMVDGSSNVEERCLLSGLVRVVIVCFDESFTACSVHLYHHCTRKFAVSFPLGQASVIINVLHLFLVLFRGISMIS
jgi:hypothetical protein